MSKAKRLRKATMRRRAVWRLITRHYDWWCDTAREAAREERRIRRNRAGWRSWAMDVAATMAGRLPW